MTKLTPEEVERLMPGDNLFSEQLKRIYETKQQYLEEMAAAFILKTRIPADQCELVQQQLPHPQYGYRFFFRVRDSE